MGFGSESVPYICMNIQSTTVAIFNFTPHFLHGNCLQIIFYLTCFWAQTHTSMQVVFVTVDLECSVFSQVPVARASILWLIGEYCERVPKIAPDVLRKTAKSFTNEDDLVKLQILNLGAKLYLTNSKQVSLNSVLCVLRVVAGFVQSV